MKNSLHLLLAISFFASQLIQAKVNNDYLEYHLKIRQAEELIAEGSLESALNVYQEIFDSFDFVFRKDCIVATQLAYYIGDKTGALKYLKKGISRGWTIKNIKKYKILQPLLKSDQGPTIKIQYDSLRSIYSKSLNKKLRTEVNEMYKKDQNMALRALFRIGEKSQTKYAEKNLHLTAKNN